MSNVALNAQNVGKSFASEEPFIKRWRNRNGKRLAVNDVSFQVNRGEIYGVLGPNGSGKSTLIRCIATLLIPDAGYIEIFGHDIERDEMIVKRLINRVSVDAAFFKKLSAMENLLYAARLYSMDGLTARRKIREILGRLGIKELNQPLEHMSRGMQQKVAIARAFLSSPILLLLDEPTTGLDPRSKREVQEFVLEMRDQHDATVLLTTHDMDEADKLCDRVAIIDNGKIIAEDTPQGLKESIRHRIPQPTLEDVFMELTGKQLVVEQDLAKEVS
ncbi:ABC transporter ATP-binding protein [Candidatus Acetothermia bacterium]|nr:ABC transporter ATP-binding protein [Candidatus Acetothermia bacterium]